MVPINFGLSNHIHLIWISHTPAHTQTQRERQTEREMAATAAGLQRSSVSFRRQGSSGSVWDDKLLMMNQMESPNINKSSDGNDNGLKEHRSEHRPSRSMGSIGMTQWSSPHEMTSSSYWATKASLLTMDDPPSPKVRGCGFFSIFSTRGHGVRNNKKY